MFNCIESDALMDLCRALGLTEQWIDANTRDIHIVQQGSALLLENGCYGVKLSDYLLATTPVDVKEA